MYLGIDLGTTGVKVLLVDGKGEVKKSVTKNYQIISEKPLWTEQNPDDWLRETISAIKEIIVGFNDKIKAISFSGQMHSLVILDEENKVIRPAILWNDQRTINETKEINDKLGIKWLLEETGNVALTGFTAPKILWVKNNEADKFRKINKIMLPKDYLVYKLTNKFVTDVSDISGSLLFNVQKKEYSEKILDFLEINKSQLPTVLESTDIVGTLTEEIYTSLGLNKDVKVIIGGGDQSIGAIGTGTVRDGEVNISLGTSGVVFVASDNYKVVKDSFIHSFAHANNNYHLMGVTLAAAGSFKWWKDTFNSKSTYDQIFEELIETDIDDTIYFLPYISGERSPINNSLAKGTFSGFTTSHRLPHFSRAVIEGINFSLRHCYEVIKDQDIETKRIRIIGGGSKNDYWSQMIADIFNLEVQRPVISEGAAFGAAIVAMIGDGIYKNVYEACEKIVKVEKTFIPNKKNTLIYNKKYEKYLTLYQNIERFFEIV